MTYIYGVMDIINQNIGNDQIDYMLNELYTYYKQFGNCIYITILVTMAFFPTVS